VDGNEKYAGIVSRFELNVSRFAAYKAFDAFGKIGELDSQSPDFDALSRVIVGTYNSYNLAEIKAVITRSRNARQWVDFEESAEIYPNLEWLPSNAVHPREDHRPFYKKIIPKTDPFWNENQPGNIWGWKCGWKETDKSADKAPTGVAPSKGMSGNPAKTGEIFSKEASYFERNNNDEPKKVISQWYYTDSKSKLNISVMADANEIDKNVRTGQILLNDFN
jgi:hypothetical protein